MSPIRERVLEIARRHLRTGQLLFVGVIDPINPEIESPVLVRDHGLLAAKSIPIEGLGTTNDCGNGPRICFDPPNQVRS